MKRTMSWSPSTSYFHGAWLAKNAGSYRLDGPGEKSGLGSESQYESCVLYAPDSGHDIPSGAM